MRSVLACVAAIVFATGCAAPSAARPVSATPDTTLTTGSPPPTTFSPAPTGSKLEWSAPISYHRAPAHPRGQWAIRAPIDASTALASLTPSSPNTDFGRFTSELARIDLPIGRAATLLTLPPGMTVFGPIVAGQSVAWVEAPHPAIDLRAYGWKLHLTDLSTGADRVVARDMGIHPPEVESVIPALAFDGTTLYYSALVGEGAGVRWELLRLRGDRADKVADLTDPARRRIQRVAFDQREVIWLEQTTAVGPQPRDTLGVYDLARGTLKRHDLGLRADSLAMAPDRVYFATESGVFELQRSLDKAPVRVSGQQSRATVVVVVGRYAIYKDYDAESVVAIEMVSQARTTIGSNVTTWPMIGNDIVTWHERESAGRPDRDAFTKP